MLMGDRRKLVNGHRVDIIGVRDEAKVHKTDFCFFGISGFELTGNGASDDAFLELKKMLALMFALSYFCSEHILEADLIKSLKGTAEGNGYLLLRKRCREAMNLLSAPYASHLQKLEQHVVAMGREKTILFSGGLCSIYENHQPVVIGAGKKVAAIYLDLGMSYETIYHKLRWSGTPTGVQVDTYHASDLLDLMPPVTDPVFLGIFNKRMKRVFDADLKDGGLTVEAHYDCWENLTEQIACFLSFLNKPRFDFSTTESRVSNEWIAACKITGLQPKEQDKKDA